MIFSNHHVWCLCSETISVLNTNAALAWFENALFTVGFLRNEVEDANQKIRVWFYFLAKWYSHRLDAVRCFEWLA